MRRIWVGAILAALIAWPAAAGEVRILTAGALRLSLLAAAPDIEKQTGHRLVVERATVGHVVARIEAGEAHDIIIATPAAIEGLTAKGLVKAGTGRALARVGVGVMVPTGAAKPPIADVEEFKRALQAAPRIAYIDPKSGGPSGIYLAGLFEKLGIAEAVAAKAKLKAGGYVADLLKSGDADLGLQQMSEIFGVEGVTLVGPLPAEIQNYTIYGGGISSKAADTAAAEGVFARLTAASFDSYLKAQGMERP